jgi:hypothetical protein
MVNPTVWKGLEWMWMCPLKLVGERVFFRDF